ncbi:MAG: hypothetical protein M0P57_14650, partial [Syntrophales bacterium]|nr:hypothetical protein [Syntrophales bacterium]
FTKNLIERHSLMPVIFSENWDKDRKSWKNGFDPTFQQTYEALQSMLEVSFNGSAMTLAFTFTDPAEAQKILTFYLADLNEFMRRQFLEDVQVRRQSLEKQLNSASDPVLKDKLSEMIIQYIQKEDLAKVKDFYGFEIIDAPFVPENRFKPERSRICMISVIAAFFAAVIIAFILEYIAYLKKNEDPKKIAELKRCIKFRSR